MAELRWVDRDSNGKVCGHYACKQREDQECLSEEHPDMLEFTEYTKNPDIRMALQDFVTKQITNLDNKVKDYVYSKYPLHRQITLTNLKSDAKLASKTDATSYLEQCWNWMQSVFGAYYMAEDAIMAIAQSESSEADKKAQIILVVESVDLSGFDLTDPKVTIRETLMRLQQE